MDWRDRAACLTVDPELFFPVGNTGPAVEQIDRAKAVCSHCPVTEYCLQYALDTNQDYWTGSMLTEWRGWNLALAYTRRSQQAAGAATVNDYQAQASIGYAFDNGITADLGWRRLRESSAVTDRIGFLFTYEFGFRK